MFDSRYQVSFEMRFRWIAVLALYLCTEGCLFAQIESDRIIKRYGIKDGLSQAVVNSITQDKKGFIWFATDDGLNRFDGYEFRSFKFDVGADGPSYDNFVQRIFNDSGGRLWVSSRRGLYRFDLSTERMERFLDPRRGVTNDVSFISESGSQKLWIAWYLSGVGVFDPVEARYDTTLVRGLSENATIVAYEDSYGYLWVGGQSMGVDVFKVTGQKIGPRHRQYSSRGETASRYVKCFLEDHLGNIWIGTTEGLIVFKRMGNSYHIFNDPGILPPGTGVFSLMEDDEKTLWIGTHGHGLFTMDLRGLDGRNTGQLTTRQIETVDNFDISRHTIRTIFQDKDGNIWFGTHGDGVYMISSQEKNFRKVQTKTMLRNAGGYIHYHGLCYDGDGYLWLGTGSHGIYKMTQQGEVVRHYLADGRKGSITDNNILSAARDHEGNLWFGTYSQGVFRYDRRSDSFVHFPHAPSDGPMTLGNRVSVLFEDSRDNIWVGATRGGLCVIDKKDRTFKLSRLHGMFSVVDVRAIAEDKQGGLWLGCYGNGLAYYHPESNAWVDVFEGTGKDNLLHSNIVYDLAIHKDGMLWIGTNGGGLGAYNTTTKQFKCYTEKEGLINNTVLGLEVAENGEVWASTIKGISCVNPVTGKIRNYTSDEGLQEGQFSQGSSLYNPQEGYICFGGAEGMNIFYPARVVEEKKIPEVKITGFQLFHSGMTIGGTSEDDVLSKVADETRQITLNHNQSSFSFEFTALNFNSTKINKYAHKLEGFDKDWNYAGNQRKASYRYVPPGDYAFKVKVTTDSHEWPENVTSIRVTVLPPFWKTAYAYLAYLVLVSLVGTAIVRNRRKQVALRKRIETEKEKRKRVKQMTQEKLSFFTEISHEFRTPLTLMIGPLEEMLAKEEEDSPAARKLKMVNRNAHKLLGLINRLLDYRKVETGNATLRLQETDFVAFTEEIFVNFREVAHRNDINFQLYTDEPSINAWIDREKMEMVINNVVSNSFKYIGRGNTISLTLKKERADNMSEFVVLEVKDNGMGIPEEKRKFIFDWYYQADGENSVSTGIGLALARKLVLFHKGQILVNSVAGGGSVFTIRLPVSRDHFRPHEAVVEESLPRKMLPPEIHTGDDHEYVGRGKGHKGILIVEDDVEVRTFLREYLEADYRVFEAGNGMEALQSIDVHNPDLIISDIMMPELDGAEFCRRVKENIRTSHISVILLTAKTALSHQKEGLGTGADAYLTKPFSPEVLSLTVQNILQSRENLRRFYRNVHITGERPVGAGPDAKFLLRLQNLLRENMTNPEFLLEKYCEELGMSRSQLYKKIKALTGQAPVEYIRSLKLAEAANLLKSQQYKVFEVADRVGFSDLKYFRKCFLKEFGYPPSQLIDK